jgi:hypothetical protein
MYIGEDFEGISVTEEKHTEMYTNACDVAFRFIEKTFYNRVWTDDFKHTSPEARSIALQIMNVIGIEIDD